MTEPLVIIGDVLQRLNIVDPTPEQLNRLVALVQDASAAVRSEAGGQLISRAQSTIRATIWNRYALPQHPVVSIASITQYDTGDPITYVWDGLNTVIFWGWPNRFDINLTGWFPPVANITYTHGYDPVPDDIVAVVAQMAGRAYGLPATESGINQESLGAYSVSYGTAAASGGVGMLPDERTIVRRYRRPRAPISML